MAVPKRRTSKSKKNMRRSHHGLSAPATIQCPDCDARVLPHRVCGKCGYYRGRNVLNLDLTA